MQKKFIDFSTAKKSFCQFFVFFVCFYHLDSYVQNYYKPGYFALDHSNEQQNHINTNYKSHNGTEMRWGEFKQPMPMKNGSNRIPALVSAKSQAFDGTTLFHRSYNKPRQTINPHYNRFGEPSELANFKSVPDLYPIKVNSSNASYSQDSPANGYDQSIFSTSRFANDTNVRSSTLSTPNSVLGSKNRSIFLNCSLNKKSTTPNTMGSKSNLTLYNVSINFMRSYIIPKIGKNNIK